MLNNPAGYILTTLSGSPYRPVRLVATLMNGLFEHPDIILALSAYGHFHPCCWHQPNFSTAYDVGQTH
jgi:hypothetical protein